MRYIYIICLLLSSFFISKPVQADNQSVRYAFFIPENSFQQNINLEVNNNQRRIQAADENNVDIEQLYMEDLKPVNDFATSNEDTSERKKDTKNVKLKIQKPYVREPLKIIRKHPKEKAVEEKELPEIHQEPISPKKEDSPVFTPAPDPQISRREKFEEFLRKDTKEMLETLPIVDYSQPKFKQIYSQYGQDLNILYTTGVLPENLLQEEILQKATNSHRFEVK